MINNNTLYIIAGANGTGKTTLAKEFLKEYAIEFLNADDIAKNINPQDVSSVRVQAGKMFLSTVKKLLQENKSFAIETTLSGNFLVKILEQAKNQGYSIILVYFFLKNPETCIDRIRIRVKHGGHSVPDEDVIRRYYRSKKNLWFKYRHIVDKWMVFYNGMDKYVLVMKGEFEEVEILNDELYNLFMETINNEK